MWLNLLTNNITMNREEAIKLMKSSRNIEEWNLFRETIKRKIPITPENRKNHVINYIDGSGLISKVLPTKKLIKAI